MNLTRNPVAAIIGFPLGIAFTGAAVLVAGLAAMAWHDSQRALEGLLWIIKRFDLRLTVPPERLANDLSAYPPIADVFVALVLFVIGAGFLRAARTAVRPADMSADGKARIILKEELARAGRRLEGTVQLSPENLAVAQKIFAVPGRILRWAGIVIAILVVIALLMFVVAAFVGAK